ncbi:MAG: M48 family peptidase [Acidobacteria bacterium]|nr:M48 family peptidase [Acidobacteriota bacterium]
MNELPFTIETRLADIFTDALNSLVKKETPQVEARFYPYTGLSSTIRLRQGRIYARVSDILTDAPRDVLYALASILIAKLYRLKPLKEQNQIYRQYILDQAVMDASDASRRERGYKITSPPQGKIYDLNELFDELNSQYFADRIARPVLSWSPRNSRRVLGHHDNIHDAIIISRALDSLKTPRYVVAFVLYHEMLHIKHPQRVVNGRKISHDRNFRDDERRFQHFDTATKWLEQNALPVRRRRQRAVRRTFS